VVICGFLPFAAVELADRCVRGVSTGYLEQNHPQRAPRVGMLLPTSGAVRGCHTARPLLDRTSVVDVEDAGPGKRCSNGPGARSGPDRMHHRRGWSGSGTPVRVHALVGPFCFIPVLVVHLEASPRSGRVGFSGPARSRRASTTGPTGGTSILFLWSRLSFCHALYRESALSGRSRRACACTARKAISYQIFLSVPLPSVHSNCGMITRDDHRYASTTAPETCKMRPYFRGIQDG